MTNVFFPSVHCPDALSQRNHHVFVFCASESSLASALKAISRRAPTQQQDYAQHMPPADHQDIHSVSSVSPPDGRY